MEVPISDLKNIHAGKMAVVIGNGPSLSSTPLDAIAPKAITFGANHVYRMFESKGFVSDYLICTDKNRLQELDPAAIKQYPGTFLYGDHTRVVPAVESVAKLAKRFVRLQMKVRTPFRKASTGWMLKFMSTRLLKYVGVEGRFMSLDAAEGINYGESVVFSAIQLAFYCGCNPIVLVGVDANYSQAHYPAEIQSRIQYVQEAFTSNPRLMMEPLLTSFKISLETVGVQLLDATVGGKLECLSKLPVERILQG